MSPSGPVPTGPPAAWRASPASSLASCISKCLTRTPNHSPARSHGLVSSGLHVVIAMGDSSAVRAGQRIVRLELVGNDRPGIVRDLSGNLARRGVSIEE